LKLTKWQSRILRIGGSVALVVGIFWFIPIAEVIASLRKVHLGYVAAGFALNMMNSYGEAIQLWLLLKRVAVPATLWTVFETKMTTRFYGQFLPSEFMAAAVKFYRLAGPTQQWGEVVAALVFFRLVNMAALALLGFTFWAIELPTGPGRWIGLVLIGALLALVVMHFVLTNPRLRQNAAWLMSTRMFAWLKGRFVDKVTKISGTMLDSYRRFGNVVWPIIGLAVARHLLGIVSFGLIALSLDIHLSLLTIGWIRVVLQAIMTLPITLSGIGLREGTLVILLQEYGVSASDAVALAFLVFAIGLLVNSLGGILEFKNFIRPGPDTDKVRSDKE
jgi:uncharacterized protein (TIRG00374 family)